MGRIKDALKKTRLGILSLRVKLQESNIRSCTEKKLILEEKLAKLQGGENCTEICVLAQARRRMLNARQKSDDRSGDELTYAYHKIKNSTVYTSVRGLFRIPRRFVFISKLVSTLFAVVQTSIFALLSLLLLPFLALGYIVYGLLGYRQYKKYAAQIASRSKNGAVILIYHTKDTNVKNINASAYQNGENAVVKIDASPSLLFMRTGVDKNGCYYGRERFLEYLKKKDVLCADSTTLIRL